MEGTKYFLADGFANLLDEYVFDFHDHEGEIVRGTYSAFDQAYLPVLRRQGVGRALEGKSNYQTLANLRTLYRAGLRALQLTGNGRNRLGDGCGQHRTQGRLTDYGVAVVREADRLGMVLDTAQLNDAGFFDLAEQTDSPLLDSHTCARELSDHPQNIGRERMEAIGRSGGVVALSFRTALVATEKEQADISDLLRQIDYAVETAGIDHVALGPDYCGFKTPKDRQTLRGLANLGFVESDYQTPYQSEKYPGYLESVWYGIRKDDFISGPSCRERFPEVIDALRCHGYQEEDCAKLLGQNLLRLYRTVLK